MKDHQAPDSAESHNCLIEWSLCVFRLCVPGTPGMNPQIIIVWPCNFENQAPGTVTGVGGSPVHCAQAPHPKPCLYITLSRNVNEYSLPQSVLLIFQALKATITFSTWAFQIAVATTFKASQQTILWYSFSLIRNKCSNWNWSGDRCKKRSPTRSVRSLF